MTLGRDILLVPMQPTPNGRLHIGHGAGTYLRADVLARALRLRGHQVRTITGSDAFENWVLPESRRTGLTPEQTCDFYHAGIRLDLSNLGVELDAWIDPRSSQHYPAYKAVHEQTLLRLQSTGAAMLEAEEVPYSLTTGQPQTGTFIAGRCPHCDRPCGGSSCVHCGEHFQPEEIVAARSRLDDGQLRWQTRKSWFIRPSDPDAVSAHLLASGVQPVILDTAIRYLTTRSGRIRLTGYSTWGIRSDLVPPDAVLANGYFLYAVYCGEVHRQLTGGAVNAFSPASGVTTIGVFGNDNSTPGMIAPHAIAQGSGSTLKPFDFTVVNGMLKFEGEKCSTSKRHGIWISELAAGAAITSDELRWCLLGAPLDEGPADITLAGIVASLNELRQWQSAVLMPAVDSMVSNETSQAERRDEVLRVVDRQHAWLRPESLNVPAALAELRTWMTDGGRREDASWLLGLALLAEPLMPVLARQLWTWLGLPAAPTRDIARTADVRVRHAESFSPGSGNTALSARELTPFVQRAATGTESAS